MGLRTRLALLRHIAKIGSMKAGNIFMRIAQPDVISDDRRHLPGGAGGKRSDRKAGETIAQRAELAILRTKFVAPLRDAMRLINGKKRDGYTLQPSDRIGAREPFRGKIQKTVMPFRRLACDPGLFFTGERTV